MKIRTQDLIGPALDWAVAKCEGLPLRRDPMGFKTGPQAGWWVWDGEGQNEIVGHLKTHRNQHDGYSPSTNWSQGGPIVDRAGIYFGPLPDKGIRAYRFIDGEYCDIMDCWGAGITRCVVGMRCFVASRLGDVVDVPKELTT